MLKAKKAQSTMEYIIVFSAIVIAVLVGAYAALRGTTNSKADDTKGIGKVLSAAVGKMGANKTTFQEVKDP